MGDAALDRTPGLQYNLRKLVETEETMRTSRGNIWNDDTLCFVLGFFLNAPGIVAAGVISGNRGAMFGFFGMMFSVVLAAGGVLLKAAFS